MSKLQYNRLFRFLVCLVLVLSFLVNLSPLKADATSVVVGKVTLDGLLAWLYSAGIGYVATDLTVDALNHIGVSFKSSLLSDASDAVVSAYSDLEDAFIEYLSSGHLDSVEWVEDLYAAFTSDTLKNIAGWLCTLVNMGGFEVESDSVSAEYVYYSGVLLPKFSEVSGKPYVYLLRTNENYAKYGNYLMLAASIPVSYYYRSDYPELSYPRLNGGINNWSIYGYSVTDSGTYSRVYTNSRGSGTASYDCSYGGDIVWSNHDIIHESNGSVWFSGSEPTTTQTEIIEPTIYVGDIPQNIIEGKDDEDTIALPLVDPIGVIASPTTALNDVTAPISDLAAGTITLDDYLELVRADVITADPDAPAEPTIGTDVEVWVPPANPGQFALDLTKFFPFCIPFDLYAFLTCLNADPVTPVIH